MTFAAEQASFQWEMENGDKVEGGRGRKERGWRLRGGGRREVGSSVVTVVDQNRIGTWFRRFVGGVWAVPGEGSALETTLDRSGVT